MSVSKTASASASGVGSAIPGSALAADSCFWSKLRDPDVEQQSVEALKEVIATFGIEDLLGDGRRLRVHIEDRPISGSQTASVSASGAGSAIPETTPDTAKPGGSVGNDDDADYDGEPYNYHGQPPPTPTATQGEERQVASTS